MSKDAKARVLQFIGTLLMGAVFGILLLNAHGGAVEPLPAPVESNVPHWTHSLAERFPNCHDIDSRPEGVIPNEVVLIPLDGSKAYREDFATAWANRKSAQFFTVGYCL